MPNLHRLNRLGLRASVTVALRYGLVLVAAWLTGGCSLLFESARPTPDEPRNVFCGLEYRPDPDRPGEPDLLFFAGGQPYPIEEFYMSLPDALLHTVFAPGRHLSEPVHLRGVICSPPVWGTGHRLPGRLSRRHYLLCRRDGLEHVEIEVRTKWGSCRREIPAGDGTPRCREWFGRKSGGLRHLSPTVCPSLPQPTHDSRRGTTPSGAFWVAIREGSGPRAEGGRWIVFHETVLTRSFVIARSTHFDDKPRRVLLGGGELPPWIEEGIEGMRVGEHRRLLVPLQVALRERDPSRPEAEEPYRYDVELVAVEEADARSQQVPPEEEPRHRLRRPGPVAVTLGWLMKEGRS